jgi:hypothetical protein
MTSSDSDTDSSTSTESTLSIDRNDYEDLPDLVSLTSSDSSSLDSSDSSDSDSVSSDDSIEDYGFIKKTEDIKKDLFRCYNCLKIFNSQNQLNYHNNKCNKYSQIKNRDVIINSINNQTFEEFVDDDTFGKLII